MADEIPGQMRLDLGLEAGDAEAAAGPGERARQLSQLRAANAGRVRELAALGRKPDPAGVLMARLNLLLDTLLDPGTRVEFEIGFESQVAGMLGRWIGEARQLSLLAPPPHEPPPTTGRPPTGGNLFIPG